MTRIAEGLATRFTVKTLCAQPTYAMRGLKAAKREMHNGVDIIRCFSTTFNKDNRVLRLFNVMTISISIFVAALNHFKKRDCVLVVTNPPMLPYITMLACRLSGAKCVVRVDDVYPDLLVAAGILKKKSILYTILDWLTGRLYHGADAIVTLGRDMAALVSRKISHCRERVRMITNWADIDVILPASKKDNILLQELGITDKFIIQWSGNMGHLHEVKSLFDAMVQLRDFYDVHFLFIGSGSKWAWLKSQVNKARLKNVSFLGILPHSDQQKFLNACDIALSSLVAGMSGISVPSRMYNILAAGKPILAIGEPDSEIGFVITEEKVGWIVPPDQPDQIVQIILEARNNPSLLAEMGGRGRATVQCKYSFGHVINKYIDLIIELGVGQN